MMEKIQRPTLIINESICRNNIRKMMLKAKSSGCSFRPHFKTHQNITVGNWFKEEGVNKITVSSVSMAKQFADAGWDDILIAFPLNICEIDDINTLASKIKLGILISCKESMQMLADKVKSKLDVYIKIDVGSKRTGFLPRDHNSIKKVINEVITHKLLSLKGLVAHAGHTYQTSNHDEIRSIYRIGTDILVKLKKTFSDDLFVSWGDTPTCSIIDDFSSIDEIRPGNFVFYDLMQLNIGVCKPEDIALIAACPVVAKHHDRNEIVIYGGAAHLSKELGYCSENIPHFGKAVMLDSNLNWFFQKTDNYVRKLSQEHGIISASDDLFNKIKSGDVIGIIPVHSCLTASLINEYHII